MKTIAMLATERAYIAGFLDGDGSIIFQLVKRSDYRLGFQVRSSICFYQKHCCAGVLEWLKSRLQLGYLRRRGEMADYTVVGHSGVERVLCLIRPYVVVKQAQVERGLELLKAAKQIRSAGDLIKVAAQVDEFSRLNYSKRRTITAVLVAETLRGTKNRLLRC